MANIFLAQAVILKIKVPIEGLHSDATEELF